jgi:hypothetical protein
MAEQFPTVSYQDDSRNLAISWSYNGRAIPRYVAVDNVAALEHKLASDGE